jgi:hypothetical protein
MRQLLNRNGLAIMSVLSDGAESLSTGRKYSILLEVAEAIVSHRDSATLFHELAGRLHLVVRFDYLACMLHDVTSNTMRLHVLETTEPISFQPPNPSSVENDSAGIVMQTQHPLIVSNVAEESRWPQLPARARPNSSASMDHAQFADIW